ncbi:MAG: type I-D CRISPR-associated protein Cas7/Csc2 [Deltaproteobacteria bacterium]|nr:type I-D CRISPR-associated protein Cas7/Csc2 [Deltaproteobacteria bacterium]
MSIIEKYADHFLSTYSNYPQGRYITLILARRIESEAIFRTEGSGEPLSKEFVHDGLNNSKIIERVVISKRKQTAVERRTGRELLRAKDLLFEKDKKSDVCALNRNNPCERCIDCMIYGYAAGGGGAQKSRVVTDDAFSLHAASVVTDTKQFNALFDNSTMRDPETGSPSSSIGTDEYIKPETIFLDMETIRDVTPDEFRYVLGNILRSTRYGAVSSRIGKVKNILTGLVFSNCELFSNLELTQAVYDALRQNEQEPDFPFGLNTLITAIHPVVEQLSQQVVGQLTILPTAEVTTLVKEITALYGDEQQVDAMLQTATKMYGPQS